MRSRRLRFSNWFVTKNERRHDADVARKKNQHSELLKLIGCRCDHGTPRATTRKARRRNVLLGNDGGHY
jgi:hypothetical protein